MLRRKPTALTVTSEDIAAFEEQLAQRKAYARYLKTGEDPQGLFHQQHRSAQSQRRPENDYEAHMQSYGPGYGQKEMSVDPNDELKPLPGAKASIVRSKDERIVGSGRGGPGTGKS